MPTNHCFYGMGPAHPEKYNLDMIQRRATGTTSNATEMVGHLGWEPLATRRRNMRLCMMYKIAHTVVGDPWTEWLTTTKRVTRGFHAWKNSTVNTTYKFSFLPRTIIYPIICLKSVCLSGDVRRMQFAILAQSPREMALTERILPRYFLSRVRVSIRPRFFLYKKKKNPARGPVACFSATDRQNGAI